MSKKNNITINFSIIEPSHLNEPDRELFIKYFLVVSHFLENELAKFYKGNIKLFLFNVSFLKIGLKKVNYIEKLKMCSIEAFLNFELFIKMQHTKKLLYIFEFLMTSLVGLISEYQLDIEPEEIVKNFEETNGEFYYVIADRQFHSINLRVLVKDDLDCFIILLKINGQDEIEVVKVSKSNFIEDIVKNIKVNKNGEIEISNIDNEICYIINPLTKNVKVKINPKIHDEVYLSEELELINCETSVERKKEIFKGRH